MTESVFTIGPIIDNSRSLMERLSILHNWILKRSTGVDRIACALYEAKTDLLKTFLNSTKSGEAIEHYQCDLSDSPSLSALAASGGVRVIDGINDIVKPTSEHSKWLLKQGYCSSLTVPIFNSGHLFGFVFFDSSQPGYFSDIVQRDLLLYSHFFMMTVTSELSAIRTLTATARASKDFAQLRDFETGAHLERMARYSRLIAQQVAPIYQLNDEVIEHIYLFAPLHDIGKIGVPDSILLKPGRLTDEERAIMQTHVYKGAQIIKKVLEDYDLKDLNDTSIMINIVSYHHEFLDGSGYPYQLTGEDIPIEARIVTIADIFDALTSLRPYKTPWTVEAAFDELNRLVMAGKLDKACVEGLISQTETVKCIISELADS